MVNEPDPREFKETLSRSCPELYGALSDPKTWAGFDSRDEVVPTPVGSTGSVVGTLINLTVKQVNVLRFFRDFRTRHGISPTIAEAATALGVSKITVHEHVTQLVSKGAVRRDKSKSRSITVLYDPDRRGFVDDAPADETIPILGTIAAGRPIEAVEDREEVGLAELVPSDGKHCIYIVGDESLTDDHISGGDMVVIEKRQRVHDGEIVVAEVGDEKRAVVGRFYREEDRIRLQPANSSLNPSYVNPDDLNIIGVVRGVYRVLPAESDDSEE